MAEYLAVTSLRVGFRKGVADVVRDVTFKIERGEAYGLVGESGSGKTLTARAIVGLLPPGAWAEGTVKLGSTVVSDASRRELARLRGRSVGMIFQDPGSFLNPLLRVGDAIAQVVRSHEDVPRRAARARAVELMDRVGISEPDLRQWDFPHQFSGGMQQRVLIAMALAARPALLLADEPTTGLDVVVQAEILGLLQRLQRDEGMSVLLVSHDFSVIAGVCSRVGVMYAGELVEEGSTEEILRAPRHPYTRGLIESLPERAASGPLPSIPGTPPDPAKRPAGCAFAPRCSLAAAECTVQAIPLVDLGAGRVTRCIKSDALVTGAVLSGRKFATG